MLNVYKVSGLPKRPKIGVLPADSKYKYWSAGTLDATNSRSYNWLLSDINEKISNISIGYNLVTSFNDVDIDILCLEALEKHKENESLYPIDFLGAVIAQMIDDGCFDNDSTDDVVRSNNLDNLIGVFQSRLTEPLKGNFSNEFLEWWNLFIIPNNYNAITSEQLERYKALIKPKEKVSGEDTLTVNVPNPEDFTSMSDYVVASGPCFLYMFIPEEEEMKYNKIIRQKRRYEIEETFEFIRRNVGGMYDDETIVKMIRVGCINYWGMTPEDKLKQVYDNGGKIGADPITLTVTEIIMLVSLIITFLSALLSWILTIYQITYTAADKAEENVPNDSDLSELMAADDSKNKKASLSTGTWVAVAAIAIGLIMKLKGDKNND